MHVTVDFLKQNPKTLQVLQPNKNDKALLFEVKTATDYELRHDKHFRRPERARHVACFITWVIDFPVVQNENKREEGEGRAEGERMIFTTPFFCLCMRLAHTR